MIVLLLIVYPTGRPTGRFTDTPERLPQLDQLFHSSGLREGQISGVRSVLLGFFIDLTKFNKPYQYGF